MQTTTETRNETLPISAQCAELAKFPPALSRLLYFTPHQAFPLTSGARLRDYHLARHLAGHCAVTFAEMGSAGEEHGKPPEHSGLAKVVTLQKGRLYGPWKILRGLVGPVPVTVLNCWSPRMAAKLLRACGAQRFDTVQIEGVHLMEYLPMIRAALGPPGVVVDWHNIESELMWRYAGNGASFLKKIAAARTATLIERAEDRLLDSVAVHTVTSERERKKLWARRPEANIRVVPNGVDAADFSDNEILEAARRARPQMHLHGSKTSILFVGSMDYHANIDAVLWFSRTAWPEIARKYPQIQFMIVGRDPAPEIRRLASERIQVTGTVDDVRPYYASAVAAVVPLRAGGGTRLKILEAMAAGVPVVSTRLGAEGIDAEDNVHIAIADSAADIAAAVGEIASSAETRDRLTAAARELVTRRYDWSAIGEELYRIHCELFRERPRQRAPQGSEA